jgi:dimethylargininase
MLIALTHTVPRSIDRCELTFLSRDPINHEIAVQQHAEYCSVLEKAGASVIELTDNEPYPDACFIEDTAVVVDEIAVISRMGAESRRFEVQAVERFLVDYRDISRIEAPGTLEGGDIIHAGRKIFAGLSARTNMNGIESLATALEPAGYQVIPIAVRNCLHLKSACTFLGDNTLLANPDWVDLSQFSGYRLIEVDGREPHAANALRIKDTVLVAGSCELTAEIVRRAGFEVQPVEISELMKAEAALTCSSIVFNA